MNENPSLSSDSGQVSLADESSVREVIVRSILSLWDVVNDLSRLRPSQQERYSVTIFGSARAVPGSVPYEETKRVANALADLGCDIITGGEEYDAIINDLSHVGVWGVGGVLVSVLLFFLRLRTVMVIGSAKMRSQPAARK